MYVVVWCREREGVVETLGPGLKDEERDCENRDALLKHALKYGLYSASCRPNTHLLSATALADLGTIEVGVESL